MALHIDVQGHGEDIVLLHGWGMTHRIWDEVARALAQNFCVHSMDLPGYGTSHAVSPYTLPALTQSLLAEFPFPVHVIGWSLGGLLGMAAALAEPDRIKSLTLVAASPCFMQRKDWQSATSPAHLQQFANNLVIDYAHLIQRFLALQVMGSHVPAKSLHALRENLLAGGVPGSGILLQGLNILRDSDLRAEIANISCPVLLQYGAKDMMTPLAAGEWLHAHLANARLVVHQQAAHIPFLSHPDDFLAEQLAFLQEI